MRTRRWLSLAVSLLSAAAIVGCGSSSSSSSSSSAAASSSSTSADAARPRRALTPRSSRWCRARSSPRARSRLPRTPATRRTSSSAPTATRWSGWTPISAMRSPRLMGLKANIVNATFDTIIPGLAAGKYDMGASSFTDTKAREKVVNFVDYFSAGTSFFTKSSGGASVTGLSTCAASRSRSRAARPRRPTPRRRARSARPPASRRSTCSCSRPRPRPTWRSPAVARSSRWPTRRSRPIRSSSRTGRSSSSADVRHGAVWPRAPEGKRAGAGGAGGAQGAGEERHVHDDPHEVGHPERRAARLRDEDQRRH